MEENTTPKRTYQKHKTDYKIAVEYKLNKKLKPEILDIKNGKENLYPLYIEVRTKGMITFFRSRLETKFSDKWFEEFLTSRVGNLFINQEKDRIVNSISIFFSQNHTSSLSKWFEMYSREIYSNSLFVYTNEILAKQINALIEDKAANEDEREYFLSLNESIQNRDLNDGFISLEYGQIIEMLSFLGFEKIEKLNKIVKLRDIVFQSLSKLNLDFSVFGNIVFFFTIQDITDGFCEKMISNYYRYIDGYNSEGITQEGKVIKTTYISRVEAINNINNFKREIEKLETE